MYTMPRVNLSNFVYLNENFLRPLEFELFTPGAPTFYQNHLTVMLPLLGLFLFHVCVFGVTTVLVREIWVGLAWSNWGLTLTG